MVPLLGSSELGTQRMRHTRLQLGHPLVVKRSKPSLSGGLQCSAAFGAVLWNKQRFQLSTSDQESQVACGRLAFGGCFCVFALA